MNPSEIEVGVVPGGGKGYQAVSTTTATAADIQARRSGSASVLVRNERGELVAERKISQGDLTTAVKTRLSQSSIPSILPIVPQKPDAQVPMSAADVLNGKDGKGSGAAAAYKEHLYALDTLGQKLNTSINEHDPTKSQGLTEDRAAALLQEFGPNVLTPPPRLPLWALFLLQFTNLLMVLLEVTALLCIVLFIIDTSVWDNLYLGVFLFIVVIITCYETYSQEAKSDTLMQQFRALVPQEAAVIRNGSMRPLPVSDLVVGDVIRVKAGDKVPADCRVILSESMKVDQSMITGEAEPVDIQVQPADLVNPLEAKNLIFNGSLVVDGAGYAVVIKTGDATLIGTMVELTGDVNKAASTLRQEITYFVKVLTVFALAQAALIFIVGLSRGYDPFQVFVYGFVVIMIGNVPQGLPTTITASLYLVAERMAKQNVFVKKLDIIETLGACTLICTDKTGTLTLNQMTVSQLWTGDRRLSAAEAFSALQPADQSNAAHKLPESAAYVQVLQTLLAVATLNSRVVLQRVKPESEPEPAGDATELGLYRYCAEVSRLVSGQEIEAVRSARPKQHEIPFNSAFKWQMSIHAAKGGKGEFGHVLYLKGAPDVLLDKCSHYISKDNTVLPIDAAFRARFQQAYETFGSDGERVLGFAQRSYPASGAQSYPSLLSAAGGAKAYHEQLREGLIGRNEATAVKDLVFVGFVTLQDPPRPEVPQAVADCHRAHVQVVMVTGDHPLTAASIARKIGLITDPATAAVIHGSRIPAMTAEDWAELVKKKEIVFARTSPEQKLTIVQEFAKVGHVTAMTGDGVNDSPALKQAAIGIAMGKNGSAVAKEAADVVLLDDNFASIVVGIREGRLLFANLKKSVAYTLAHLTPEVVPVLFWGLAGVVQPMGGMLTLCIDLLTELLPATSFVYEKEESVIMTLPPRNMKTDRLTSMQLLCYSYLQAGMILTGGCLLYFYLAFLRFDVPAVDVMNNNNKFFPAADDERIFVSSNGEEYDSDKQKDILQRVMGGWYLCIVIGQCIHLFNVRTNVVSIFEHGLFANRTALWGVVWAVCLGCFIVYTPGVSMIMSARRPFSLDIFYAVLLMNAAFWPFCEGRKWFTRNYPEHWLNRYLAW